MAEATTKAAGALLQVGKAELLQEKRSASGARSMRNSDRKYRVHLAGESSGRVVSQLDLIEWLDTLINENETLLIGSMEQEKKKTRSSEQN